MGDFLFRSDPADSPLSVTLDIREKLFYKLAEARISILKMQATRVSLEDVFLELTENEREDSSEKENLLEKQMEDNDKNQEEMVHDSDI